MLHTYKRSIRHWIFAFMYICNHSVCLMHIKTHKREKQNRRIAKGRVQTDMLSLRRLGLIVRQREIIFCAQCAVAVLHYTNVPDDSRAPDWVWISQSLLIFRIIAFCASVVVTSIAQISALYRKFSLVLFAKSNYVNIVVEVNLKDIPSPCGRNTN